MAHPKFTVLACLLVAAAVTGSSYTFGVYSSALKEKVSYKRRGFWEEVRGRRRDRIMSTL
jgi:hypothetical protein